MITAQMLFVEWITDDFGENFPYKEKEKKDNYLRAPRIAV
jgi:hypothetical protein